MTIADDMRAAAHGELTRTKAQLKAANDEIEQLRRDLTTRTHGMFIADERAKDLARKLDQFDQRAAADLDVLSATQYELDRMTARRDTWKRIALAYRCDRNDIKGQARLHLYVSGWSIARRMARLAKEMSA